MLDENEKLPKENSLFSIRKYTKEKTAYEKAKNFYFALSIILSLLIIGSIYYFSSASDIYRIAVEGNEYLKREAILAQSGLTEDTKFLLFLPYRVERSVEELPLVKDAKVKRMEGRLVQITVEEKKIVGYIQENGLNVLLMSEGEKIGIGKNDMYLIGEGPIIEGFSEEELTTLIKEVSKCDMRIIKEISEIHKFPELKFQDVELVMRDGNYIFTSVYGMEILNHYFEIESSYLSKDNHCYYFEDISGNAYTSACPWEVIPEQTTETNEE